MVVENWFDRPVDLLLGFALSGTLYVFLIEQTLDELSSWHNPLPYPGDNYFNNNKLSVTETRMKKKDNNGREVHSLDIFIQGSF